MTAYVRNRPAVPFLIRAALLVLSVLVTAWITCVALLAALFMAPVLALTALVARLRGAPPQQARRFHGAVINAEYRVIPPER